MTSTAYLDTRANAIEPVSILTDLFTVSVNKSFTRKVNCPVNGEPTLSFYEESVQLGHPGTLAAAYIGKKAYIAGLSEGRHVIVLDQSFQGEHTRTLTYVVTVKD